MEIVIWCLFALAVAILIVAIDRRYQRIKRQEAHDAEIKAASEAAAKRKMVEPLPASEGPYIRSGRVHTDYSYRRAYPQPSTPAPTVVREDNTGSLLMAGAVGYLLASSGNSHAHAAEPAPAESCKPEPTWHGGGGSYDGSGASSSYESSSSSDSGSSDSGSSSSSTD